MTYKEWFEANLPKEIAEKAIKYTDMQYADGGNSDTELNKFSSVSPLRFAFIWDETFEGHEFWHNLEKQLS